MCKNECKNSCPREILLHAVIAALGLALFGVGVYMTIQANIGVAPWDCFYLGLQKTTGIKYGNISVCISLILIVIDLLMKEKIGIGMILDAVIVGKTVDLCDALELIPAQQSIAMGVVCMLAGLVINGCGQYLYMRVGLCCGPRDSLLLGLSKKIKKVPIGAVSIMILVVVLCLGWRLGGPIGIGTVISTFLMGPIMQLVFHVLGFDPKRVENQDLVTSAKILTAGSLTAGFKNRETK